MSLNTTPRTWVAGETVTAAHMNAEVRDALSGIQAAWTSWGSGSSWTAATGNPSLGNGTWTGKYLQIGKLIIFSIEIVMGSTTTYGTGQWRLALPVTPRSANRITFTGDLLDTGTASFPLKASYVTSVTAMTLTTEPTTAGATDRSVTSAVPHTWGTGDALTLWGVYEAA